MTNQLLAHPLKTGGFSILRKMNILNEKFDRIFLITSFSTLDRMDDLISFFNKENIEFELIVSPKKKYLKDGILATGNRSLCCSNESIFLKSKQIGYNSILIFEDDVYFENGYEELFFDFYKTLPDKWQVLNLGFHCHSTQIYSDECRSEQYEHGRDFLVGTHAMAYNINTFDHIIDKLDYNDRPIDLFMAEQVYDKFNVYYPTNKIFYASSYREYELDRNEYYKKYKSEIC